MALLALVASQVHIGEALPFNVRDAQGKLLLAQGQVIASEAQLVQLLARGSTVDEAELEAARRSAAAATATPAVAPRLTLFDLWAQAVRRLERLLAGLGSEPEPGARFDRFADDFLALVRRDVDIAVYLAVRQDPRRMALYGLTHAVHTALIGCLMAEQLGWPAPNRQCLIKGALTMNLAIVDLQGRLATQEDRPTAAQRAAIHSHPQDGHDRLRAAGVADAQWLGAVLEHHEQADGSGYPRGLRDVSSLAAALRLADVFMAKISPRLHRPPLPIQDAARQMFQQSGGNPMAAAIVKAIGLYPPGDFVQLANGEQAVVVRRGSDVRTPLAASITDARGAPVVHTVQRDTSQPAFAIVGPAPNRKLMVRVPPERLYGLA